MKVDATEVQELLHQMAYPRQTFKDRVEEKVGGALMEYYKAECATANRLSRWVEHWRTEVRRLVSELQVVLLHDIRGFKDRRKAFEEVLISLQTKDPSYRRAAEATVAKDFRQKKLKAGVPREATARFEEMVRDAAAEILES